MIEKKIIAGKKDEFAIKEFVKSTLGKGKVSNIKIERTPIGERIIVFTTRPAVIIGRKGEAIQRLTEVLRKQFKLENPKIEIAEIADAEFDAQTVADHLALTLERLGPSVFKRRAYAALDRVKAAGALGAEILLSGKLPGEKARTWRFSFGYLKKTGTIDIVNKAEAVADTRPGVVGIKVEIVPKDAKIPDRIETGVRIGIETGTETSMEATNKEIKEEKTEEAGEEEKAEEAGEKETENKEGEKGKKAGEKKTKKGRKKKSKTRKSENKE